MRVRRIKLEQQRNATLITRTKVWKEWNERKKLEKYPAFFDLPYLPHVRIFNCLWNYDFFLIFVKIWKSRPPMILTSKGLKVIRKLNAVGDIYWFRNTNRTVEWLFSCRIGNSTTWFSLLRLCFKWIICDSSNLRFISMQNMTSIATTGN